MVQALPQLGDRQGLPAKVEELVKDWNQYFEVSMSDEKH